MRIYWRTSQNFYIILSAIFIFLWILMVLFNKLTIYKAYKAAPFVHFDDVKHILKIGTEVHLELILFEADILNDWRRKSDLVSKDNCVFFCNILGSISFALYESDTRKLPNFLERAAFYGFTFSQFLGWKGKTSHLLLKRYGSPLHITVLHWQTEAGYWKQFPLWGRSHEIKPFKEFFTVDAWNVISSERAFDRFKTKKVKMDGVEIIIPQNIVKFLEDFQSSIFIPCNTTRSKYYYALYPEVQSPETLQFEEEAGKLLSKAKVLLDELGIPFWISSGTCLGFFRQCKFIPWSMDVDIGIFIKDYKKSLVPTFERHGLKVIHSFGKVNDSYELSFKETNVKLDIFFFYNEGGFVWNGGTQIRTRKKFKYIFPSFSLCWTEFVKLKVRIPCDTEKYIIANYGKNWFNPEKYWDWKASPNNVQENGVWSSKEMNEIF